MSTGLRRLSSSSSFEPRMFTAADGSAHRLPAERGLTHLQFRRFAGCPICAHHLQPFIKRQDEIEAAGITEIIAFRSSADSVRQEEADVPFTLLPDPEGKLYAECGVESTIRSLLKPQAWLAFAQGVVESRKVSGSFSSDDHLGLPADVLLNSGGEVLAAEYGDHAAAGWSVDDVVKLASKHR